MILEIERNHKPLYVITDTQKWNFWKKVFKGEDDECWRWIGCLDKDGYGRYNLYGLLYRTNRIAYYLTHNVDPGDMMVLHSCDKPTVLQSYSLVVRGPTRKHQTTHRKVKMILKVSDIPKPPHFRIVGGPYDGKTLQQTEGMMLASFDVPELSERRKQEIELESGLWIQRIRYELQQFPGGHMLYVLQGTEVQIEDTTEVPA